MDLIQLNKKLFVSFEKVLNIISNLKYVFLDKLKYRNNLNKNRILEGIENGKKCFVIGNGPSLKNVDISVLGNTDIITVNKCICTPIFRKLKPRYHIVLDKVILEQVADNIEKDLIENKSDTIFVLHRSASKRFSKYKRVYIIYGTRLATNESAIRCKMHGNMTTYINVLPFAIQCAIYFGYKNIITLGNDFSFFASRKELHYYDVDQVKNRKESLYQDLAGCMIALLEYRSLYEYTKKQGILLVNATEGSLLDEIPQKNLMEVI